MKPRMLYDENMPRTGKGKTFEMESLTDPMYATECDIGYQINIMSPSTAVPVFGDEITETYEELQLKAIRAKRRFMQLSPADQMKFGTPSNFFKWCTNPENYELNEKLDAVQPIEEITPPKEPPKE